MKGAISIAVLAMSLASQAVVLTMWAPPMPEKPGGLGLKSELPIATAPAVPEPGLVACLPGVLAIFVRRFRR